MPNSLPIPVLVLGGQENALSILRSFGRMKIPAYISAPPGCFAKSSRYCTGSYPVPATEANQSYWHRLLLDEHSPVLQGCVIFAGSDEAVEFLATHRKALLMHYRLDDADPDVDLSMLSKQKTMELAQATGCPTPLFHHVKNLADIDRIKDDILYPVMLKPIYSHLFQIAYPGKKHLIAQDSNELHAKASEMLGHGLKLVLSEIIPGPDHLQSAFFAYITQDGKELFNYTHQIIRRYPKNCGLACLTETKWLPDTAAMGQRFLHGIGLRGMAHVEFKLDERDGRLKLIECNPRMSAAQAIVTRSGLDMPLRIYNYLVHKEKGGNSDYRIGVKRWWFYLDVRALMELHHLGELSFVGWIKSIGMPPIVFPYFCLDDPKPFFSKTRHHIASALFSRNKATYVAAPTSPSPTSHGICQNRSERD